MVVKKSGTLSRATPMVWLPVLTPSNLSPIKVYKKQVLATRCLSCLAGNSLDSPSPSFLLSVAARCLQVSKSKSLYLERWVWRMPCKFTPPFGNSTWKRALTWQPETTKRSQSSKLGWEVLTENHLWKRRLLTIMKIPLLSGASATKVLCRNPQWWRRRRWEGGKINLSKHAKDTVALGK